MDLTIRDWMVIAGVLLILAVLLDAWRRVRNDRRAALRVKLNAGGTQVEDADDIVALHELPNGGARVVDRGDLLDAAAQHKAERASGRAAALETRRAARRPIRKQPEAATAPQDPAPAEPAAPGPAQPTPATPVAAPSSRGHEPVDDDELVTGFSGAREPENIDWLETLEAGEPDDRAPASEVPGRLPRDVEPEVFMLNVVARTPQGFAGEDILHILLACDLRFGDMCFFHRHEFEAGRGAIQFSVANMMQPGVFDIDNMSDFNTPGLVFFVTLPGPEDMMQAFDYMLETAQAVARNLGGDVLDESRSVVTRQTLEHCRQQIRDLERRLLARAH